MRLNLNAEILRTLVFSSSDIVKAISMFVGLVIFSHFLPASEYGVMATYVASWGFLTYFIGHSTQSAFESYYVNAKKKEEVGALVGAAVGLIAFNCLILQTLHFIFDFSSYQNTFGFFDISWLLLCSSLHSIYIVFLSYLHMNKAKKVYFYVTSIFSLFSQLIAIGLCFYYKNWQVMLIGQLVVLILVVLYIFKDQWRLSMSLFSGPTFSRYLKSYYFLGCKGFFSFIGLWGLTSADRFLLNKYASFSETGFYSAAYQFTLLVPLLAFAINRAYMPKIFASLDKADSEANRYIFKYFVGSFLFFGVVSGLSCLIIPYFIKYLLDPSYLSSEKYIYWLMLGQYFYACYVVVATVINYHRKFELVSISAFWALVVNVALNVFLIQSQGPVGAAVATGVSYFLLFLLILFFSLRLLRHRKSDPLIA